VLTSWFENFYLPEVRAVEFHFAVSEWVHACSSSTSGAEEGYFSDGSEFENAQQWQTLTILKVIFLYNNFKNRRNALPVAVYFRNFDFEDEDLE